ncbi:lysophospholipase L1-like esterase [Enterococcus sp. PF1-24]|uniref:SGNH/GDSL hydrolase family protein n=1 Tax=unclassified Enterococcus TaxID=2608891 RepID=UPI0024748930|nr:MULTISPECIES: GDSL-type esterase/lipase family protein [unclassified Enterococcus]MDH6363881.1 lysophospholipase L1-like esterase [Enterococcus sp. PFB1-1]MDH6400933.1 lysophospholipase L1-like esterase [Enterococcus sp. PF1-24]
MRKIVLFGDSITGGYLNYQNSDILTEMTAKHLSNMGFPDNQWVNHGVNGETSRDALRRLATIAAENADLVVVFFGDNDIIDEKVAVAEYQANLQKIVEQLGADKVLLVGPTYIRSVDQSLLQQYVAAAEAVGKETVSFLNMYQHMTVYPGVNEFLQTDGLHLSEAGYDLLSSLIARDLKVKMLKDSN